MSTEFIAQVNDSTERLMSRGDWEGTVVPIQVCARKGCVVFPRYVGWIRKTNICRHPINMHNLWWDWMPYHDSLKVCWEEWAGDRCSLNAGGRSPVFQDVMGEGRTIRAYLQSNDDVGKTMRIFGTDNNGQVLRENDGTDGVPIVLQKPFGSTNTFVRHIDRVIRDQTIKPVAVYAYDATNDVLEDVAYYEPSETNPSYAKYQLNTCQPSGCCGTVPLVALVKLQFVRVQQPTDLVLIENTEALTNMVMAVQAESARDYANAQAAEARAVRALNLQLYNRDKENLPVTLGEFGGVPTGRMKVF